MTPGLIERLEKAEVTQDLTAWRAVDACGGAYTPEEETSGYAQGHREALASACEAVKDADKLASDLLEALTWAVRQIDTSMIETEAAAAKYDAALAAILKARATQEQG